MVQISFTNEKSREREKYNENRKWDREKMVSKYMVVIIQVHDFPLRHNIKIRYTARNTIFIRKTNGICVELMNNFLATKSKLHYAIKRSIHLVCWKSLHSIANGFFYPFYPVSIRWTYGKQHFHFIFSYFQPNRCMYGSCCFRFMVNFPMRNISLNSSPTALHIFFVDFILVISLNTLIDHWVLSLICCQF